MLLPPVGIQKMSIDLSLRRNPIRWDKTAITFVRSWDSKEGVAGETRQERARLINTKRIGDSFIVESTPSFLLAAQQQEKSRHFPFFLFHQPFASVTIYLWINKVMRNVPCQSDDNRELFDWNPPKQLKESRDGWYAVFALWLSELYQQQQQLFCRRVEHFQSTAIQ